MKPLSIVITILTLFLSNATKAQDTYNFKPIRMGGGGYVTGIITCPTEKNLIYARTDVGGAYRWNETDKSWTPLLDWINDEQWTLLGVESMAIDPQSPNKVYMSCGLYTNSPSTILRSTDYGATFLSSTDVLPQINGNGMGRQNGERLAVDPNKGSILFCGFRNGTLYKSTNSATNWSKVSSFTTATTSNGNGVCVVAFDKSTGTTGNATQRIFVGVSRIGSNNLFVSEDAGATWNPVAGAVTTLMPQRFFVSHGILYVAYANAEGPWNPSSGAIKKYNIATATWTDISPSNLPFGGITQDASNPDVLMATTINQYKYQNWTSVAQWGDCMYRSTNGGTSWTELYSSSKMTLSPTDTWNPNLSLHWAGSIEIDPFNSNRVFVISGNGLFMTENISAVSTGKATWNFMVKGIEETVPFGIVSMPNDSLVSVIGDYSGFLHSDITAVPKQFSVGGGTNTSLAMASDNNKYLVRSGDNLYYSLNGGVSWKQMSKPAAITTSQGNVAISKSGATILWSPKDTVYKTTDKGVNWTKLTGFINGAYIIPDPVIDNKFYAYNSSTGKFMISTDGGSTFAASAFTSLTGGSPKIAAAPGREGDIWIAQNSNGLYRTKNSGTSFSKVSNVTVCKAVAFGKAATGDSFPTIFIFGKVAGGSTNNALYRSTNEGVTWVRINDDAHQYGGLGNGNFLAGDMNVYGRVFMSSWGRGIICGEIASSTGVTNYIEKTKYLYPTVATDMVYSQKSVRCIDLYSLCGVKVLETNKTPFSVSSMKAGWYVAKIFTLEGVKTQMLLKK